MNLNKKQIHSIKEYILDPIVLKLTDEEINFRNHVMANVIKSHWPYIPQNDKEYTLLASMAKKNTAVINDENNVTGIYPVSAQATNKKVIFEDDSYSYAMCAIDAIGYNYTFNEPIRIEGECQHSREEIILEVKNGKIKIIKGSPEIHVLHTDLQNTEDWSCCCCNIMHFFSSKKNLEAWMEDNNITSKVFALDLEMANKISWLLFSQ